MLVVVGSRLDPAACEIVARWEKHGAALLGCEDLSAPGWRHRPSDRAASRAVVGGQIVRESDIRGVLVRRPWIVQQELNHIAAADREFVAAEMSAFLLAWLTHLPCRVLNRPRGTSLCGPNWRAPQWAQTAARVGMQDDETRWRVPARPKPNPQKASAAQPVAVTIVGYRWFGEASREHAALAGRLAAAAGVGLLAVWFVAGKGAPRFVGANPMPGLSDPRVADAVCDTLLTDRLAG